MWFGTLLTVTPFDELLCKSDWGEHDRPLSIQAQCNNYAEILKQILKKKKVFPWSNILSRFVWSEILVLPLSWTHLRIDFTAWWKGQVFTLPLELLDLIKSSILFWWTVCTFTSAPRRRKTSVSRMYIIMWLWNVPKPVSNIGTKAEYFRSQLLIRFRVHDTQSHTLEGYNTYF